MLKPDFSLILPAYNEGKNIAKVVRAIHEALLKAGISFELIVVNNGSTDDTETVLSGLVTEIDTVTSIHLPQNLGYGGGIIQGLAIAKGAVLGWIDADGQQLPEDIVRLYRSLTTSSAGIAKAIRVIRHDHLFRLMQSYLFNRLFTLLFGRMAHDINAKPKLMRREAYIALALAHTDWFIDAELIIKAIQNNIPIIEIPVEWVRRSGGRSNVRLGTAIEFIRNMLRFCLRKGS